MIMIIFNQYFNRLKNNKAKQTRLEKDLKLKNKIQVNYKFLSKYLRSFICLSIMI